MSKNKGNFSASIIIYLLVIMYFSTGISKLISAESQITNFETWGYNTTFMYVIGAAEVIGAIGLLIPRTRFVSVLVLSTIMLGAIGTHLINGEYLNFLLPFVLLIILAFVLFRKRATIAGANLMEDDRANY